MYESDPDVFAVLTPWEDNKNITKTAFSLEHNQKRYVRIAPPGLAIRPMIDSREPTPGPPSPDSERSEDQSSGVVSDHLVLRFSDDLSDPLEGIQLGTHARSDVLLGARGTNYIFACQGAIMLGDSLRWWYSDLYSRYGSAVAYDGKAKDDFRRRDRWILAYAPGQEQRWKEIVIRIKGGLKFRVEFPNQLVASPAYLANLCAFLEHSRVATPAVGAINLSDSSLPSTGAPSQPYTPNDQPVYIDDGLLGKGAFAEVRCVMYANFLSSGARRRRYEEARMDGVSPLFLGCVRALADPRLLCFRETEGGLCDD